MNFNNKNIIIDPHPNLRKKSNEVTIPLSKEDIEIANGLRSYVVNSIDEKKCKLMDLSPAVGIAAPQVNILKRICVVYIEMEDDIVDLVMINPKIIAYSAESVFIENGEACLSILEEKHGLVHRHNYIKIKYTNLKNKEVTHEAYGFEAIAIQHEIDHLNGVLFYDHFDKNNPMKIINNSFPLS